MPAQWQLHGRALARAVSHSASGCLTSVLVVAFPGADLGGRGQPSCRPLGRSSWRRLGAPLRSFHHHRLLTVMPVLTPIPAAAVTPLAAPTAAGPDCSLQRSGALWQLISWPSWRSHLPARCSALATSCPPWCTSETQWCTPPLLGFPGSSQPSARHWRSCPAESPAG